MNHLKLAIYLLFLLILCSCVKRDGLHSGQLITESITVRNTAYHLDSSKDFNDPVIVISGENITVDFNGASIIGDTNYTAPNQFTGIGILIKGGKNITIKNLAIQGYKIGLFADGVDGLTIEGSDFSYNYRPRLQSIREREDFSDWLSYHDNENDDWLKFGSGIYLKNCNRAVIRNNYITQNQNALLMVKSDSGRVYNNNFVFNSGLGLGMYRSSFNAVKHNCLDFNVRGYSHGFYERGQDSAGILVYEQSSNNVFAYNSATHSGDGFFLWAGQTTMDSGEGGCNDNIIAYNDFSDAPTNGIEVTFSSNLIFSNKVIGCRYGVWAGYSHHTSILNNEFGKNSFGVAFEHGNNNNVMGNSFYGDEVGIKLWERESQPADWGFAQKRNIRSQNYHLAGNTFIDVPIHFDIKNTSAVDSTSTEIAELPTIKRIYSGVNPDHFLEMTGRDKIVVNEWGPYNFEYPLIHLISIDSGIYRFVIWGEGTSWEIEKNEGFYSLDKTSGVFPDTLTGIRNRAIEKIFVELKYSGDDFYDQWGRLRSEEGQEIFSFTRFEKNIDWKVSWFNYDSATDPITDRSAIQEMIKGKPVFSEEISELAYTWWRSPASGVAPDRFITVAQSQAQFEKGKYVIKITSDDGIRFFVDGNLEIDHWDVHVPATDTVQLTLDGLHDLRIEHFEAGGLSVLTFDLDQLK